MQAAAALRHLSFLIIIFHFLALRLAAGTASPPPPYNATDFLLLNCGAPSKITSDEGRDWDTDNHYLQFMPTNTAAISFQATTEQGPSIPQVPFTTARVFTSQLTYSFHVSPGQKFLRLYFYPAQYSGGGRGFNQADFFFSVTANDHVLLKNFSAFLTASPSEPTVKKEFIVDVDDKHQLNLTFSPSPNAYAFVNGIEIVSIPSDLYVRGDNYPIQLVGQASYFTIDNSTTFLETLYRLNVGGQPLGPTDDTGMFREWSDDKYYFVYPDYQTPSLAVPVHYTNETPAYTAPNEVYTSARTMDEQNDSDGLFWEFPVDAGFSYLFRFYFCEFEPEVSERNQRVFSIEVNNSTAEDLFEVIEQSGGPEVPIMRDYVILVPDPDTRRSKHNVSLSLRPNMEEKPMYRNAILNGLEIFKLNDSTGSLAVPNPREIPATQQGLMPEKKGRKGLVAIIGGSVGGVAALLLIILIIFLIFRPRKRPTANLAPSVTKSSWATMVRDLMTTLKTRGSNDSCLPLDLCRHFSLDELKLATGNFNENFVIGRGGFGKVYRGYIDADKTSVAIKRLSPESRQGFREFQTEIKMLSKLRHLHLVSLIGYCDTDREMILVYDYMAQGTLRDHLYNAADGKPPLPWKQRLEICIGAAKGLHYLHAGAIHPIIHRDVKSTNILLDEKWVAKLSDFGLSKVGPLGEAVSHISTGVKGSFGYVDPEYYKRRQVTEKSDVYSFGVVLFEVLCARAAVIPNLSRNKVSLAEWGRRNYETGDVGKIVDPNLKGHIAPECLIQYVEIAYNCLKDQGIDRPVMNDVVWGLEFALQLQDAADKRGGLPPPRTPDRSSFPLLAKGDHGEAANKSDENYGGAFTTSEDVEKMFKTKSNATATSTIYDYMAHGTLRDHLYNAATRKPPLPWKQRLKICIGAAKGLHYLHAGAIHPIIHRDVKSTNILLDEKWVAKLSDFGLSKVGPLGEAVSHISTDVKGTFGYVDPEYYRRGQITKKSDVYSFGVVMFEVLCARAAVILNLPGNRVNLAEWGRQSYETGDIGEIVDPNLKGQIAPECLIQYAEIACNCLKDQGINRPAMNDVVWGLEFALQLQDAADKRGDLPPPRTPDRPSFPLLAKDGDDEAANKSDENYSGAFTTSEDAEKMFKTKCIATATSTSDDSLRGQCHTIFSEFSNRLGR